MKLSVMRLTTVPAAWPIGKWIVKFFCYPAGGEFVTFPPAKADSARPDRHSATGGSLRPHLVGHFLRRDPPTRKKRSKRESLPAIRHPIGYCGIHAPLSSFPRPLGHSPSLLLLLLLLLLLPFRRGDPSRPDRALGRRRAPRRRLRRRAPGPAPIQGIRADFRMSMLLHPRRCNFWPAGTTARLPGAPTPRLLLEPGRRPAAGRGRRQRRGMWVTDQEINPDLRRQGYSPPDRLGLLDFNSRPPGHPPPCTPRPPDPQLSRESPMTPGVPRTDFFPTGQVGVVRFHEQTPRPQDPSRGARSVEDGNNAARSPPSSSLSCLLPPPPFLSLSETGHLH